MTQLLRHQATPSQEPMPDASSTTENPAPLPHVSCAEQSDVSAELAKFTKSHTPEKSGSTLDSNAQSVCENQISDFRTMIKLQCNLECVNTQTVNI